MRSVIKVLHSIKRIVMALLAIPFGLFVLCLPVFLYGYILSFGVNERVPPPGRMIDIGTHKLHINCAGEGFPTVVLEAGGADWSASWTAVKNLLSDEVRVCSYDRAGLGWSERGPNPRNAEVIASELVRLLENAEEEPPYLFVGHSFGGTIGLSFASRNLENVAGFVAVETPTYAFMKWRHETRFILQGRSRMLAGLFLSVTSSAFRIVYEWIYPVDIDNHPIGNYSEEEKALVQDIGFKSRMMPMIFREEPFVESLKPTVDFESLPIVVIQGAISHLASAQWDENQQELLNLSTNSKLIYVWSSDHGVPRQAPESVVEGINWIRAHIDR